MPDTLIKTIQIVNVRWFNATAWYGINLAKLLNNAGHTSLVLGLKNTDSFHKAQAMGLNPIALPLTTHNPLLFPKLIASLNNIIKTFQPDIINCHRGESFIFSALLANRHNCRVVRTRGDIRKPKNSFFNRLLHKNFAQAVISTNSSMTNYFNTTMQVPASMLHTIRGGVDTSMFYPSPEKRTEQRKTWGLKESDYLIGLLGRFDYVKGHETLLAAVKQLHQQGHTRFKLALIGFGTTLSEDDMRAMVNKAELTDHCIITGKVPDICASLNALDLGIIASHGSEAIARAALEIMACNCPLASTTVGVMPDLLLPEALCNPNNSTELATRIQQFATQPDFVATMLKHQHTVMQELTFPAFLNKTLAVYRKILAP